MRVPLLVSPVLVAALAGVAPAQAPPPPAASAEAPAKPFPVALAARGFAPSESLLGVYLRHKSVGRAQVRVTAGKPAGFHVESTSVAEFSGQKLAIREAYDVGADLALAGYTLTQESPDVVMSATLTRVTAGMWNRAEATAPAGEKPVLGAATACDVPADLVPETLLVLLLGRVPWAEGTRYVVHTIADGAPVTVIASFAARESLDLFGKATPASRIECAMGPGGATKTYHIVDGRVVRILDTGFTLLLGTADQCATDLPVVEAPGEKEVRASAEKLLCALVLGDRAAAEATIDFAALQKRVAARKEEVGLLSLDAFKAQILEQLVGGELPPAERAKAEAQVANAIEISTVTVAGDTAKLRFPGERDSMEWAKRDGNWRLVWWATVAGE